MQYRCVVELFQVCTVQFCDLIIPDICSTGVWLYYSRYAQYSFVVLTLLMAMFTVLAHWLACIWYYIGLTEIKRNDVDWNVGKDGYLSKRVKLHYLLKKTIS